MDLEELYYIRRGKIRELFEGYNYYENYSCFFGENV